MSDDETTDETTDSGATTDPRPHLRVVRGDPSPEDVAALTVVLAAASGGGEEPPPGPLSRWAERGRLVRRPVTPGPGGWRASSLPG